VHPLAWNDHWFGRRPHGVLPQRQETFGDDRAKAPASRGPARSNLVLRQGQRHVLRRPSAYFSRPMFFNQSSISGIYDPNIAWIVCVAARAAKAPDFAPANSTTALSATNSWACGAMRWATPSP